MFLAFLILLGAISPMTAPVQAAEALEPYAYLEPKFLLDENQTDLYPLYDTELADFFHLAASEAYDIEETGSDYGTGLHPVFGNVQLFSVDDYSIKLYKYEGNNTLHGQLRLTANFLTAAKSFDINGEEKNVVLVSFRGTAEPTDWMIDALIADNDGFHLGFSGCADLAYDTLMNYAYPALGGESFASVLEKAKDPTSGYYILVTGHSLGGAVANIFTSKYLNEATQNPLNTLCYTFAAPKVCSNSTAQQYDSSNIINIKNSTDIVPNVGYLLTSGTVPGHSIYATTTETEDGLDTLTRHSLDTVYRNVLDQVHAAPTEHYRCFTRDKRTPAEVVVSLPSYSDAPNNSIPAATENRYAPYTVVVAGGLGLHGDTTLPRITVREGGWLTCTGENNRITEHLIVEGGEVELGGGSLTVGGDLRLQKLGADGSYLPGDGKLIMKNESGHLTVMGDVVFQGASHVRGLSAGLLELKGDFYALPSTGGQCEFVFSPDGTHRVLMSGTQPQTIYFSPYVDNSSYISAAFNLLESTNPHPLIAPHPISMNYLRSELSFQGDLTLDYHGDLLVDQDAVLTAENVFLLDAANPIVEAHLTIDGNLSGYRVDIGDYQGAQGILTVTGDMVETDLYYSSSLTPSIVEVQGDYISNDATLCLCTGILHVYGDLRYQTRNDDGSFSIAEPGFASLYEGSQIIVDGDLYLQLESGENLGISSECSVILKGDLIQICDSTDESFWNYGLRNLVLAGAHKQTISAPRLYFTDLTLANTSREGVVFTDPIYNISGVFNAYGRADGTITPYHLPAEYVPNWKDSDGDSIPDCLDPDPNAAAEYDTLPAAISAGMFHGDTVRFLYAVTGTQLPPNTVVYAASYAGETMRSIQQVSLTMQPEELHSLELVRGSDIDCIKIFQCSSSTFAPLCPAAEWSK